MLMFRRSTIVFTLAAAFIAGIAFRSWVALPFLINYILGLCGIVILALGKKGIVRLSGAVILIAVIGIGRLELALTPPPLSDISHFAGVEVTLTGIVAASPDVRMRTTRAVVSAHEVAVKDDWATLTLAGELDPTASLVPTRKYSHLHSDGRTLLELQDAGESHLFDGFLSITRDLTELIEGHLPDAAGEDRTLGEFDVWE